LLCWALEAFWNFELPQEIVDGYGDAGGVRISAHERERGERLQALAPFAVCYEITSSRLDAPPAQRQHRTAQQ
jgi:hypothetical protein